LVDTLGERLQRHVPISVYWYASEDGGHNGGSSTSNANAHGDVDG
jgi:hypothetical protein